MVFGFWSYPAGKSKELLTELKEEAKLPSESTLSAQDKSSATDGVIGQAGATVDSGTETSSIREEGPSTAPPSAPITGAIITQSTDEPVPRPRAEKRFSWRTLVQPRASHDRKVAPPTLREEAEKEAVARREYTERRILRARSDKRAHASALVVRELIIGPFAAPSAAAPPKSSKVAAAAVPPRQKVSKVKAQLLEPKSAKKVIAQLRRLPSSGAPVVVGKTSSGEDIKSLTSGPIHAVCLPYTDAEAHEKRFAKLDKVPVSAPPSPGAFQKTAAGELDLSAASSRTLDGITSVTTSSYEKLKEMLSDLDVISLITVPDLGFGQPGDAPGLLSGAVPTAKTVIEGVEQITPQLMALGYATGKSILPSHAGVYPPTDRMSVITYWWGLEVVIPEPSVQYLSNVPSIAHTVINFLTALSVANGGVREILPFVRYMSQYIDAEFNAIRGQDEGQGVVCAATWIMPAALVPRPWDFPQPPPDSKPADGDKDAPAPAPPASDPGLGPIMLTPPLPQPNHAPAFVAPPAKPAVQTAHVPGNDEEGVPEVTVTPPTPPASETLGKAAGAAFSAKTSVSPEDAADLVDENGVAARCRG
ncbi:hypothetical protein OH76DRAFT_1478639 [Lentinus brumalis]|uniref:Uncharacterized protein n=1 Tax=Lentinus brumalis TaxID=2498619 RepID=A0A371DRM6_9APHY|nr:hypothetical protein OH76DRAFT_1478639 [Polyporus brumalis]